MKFEYITARGNAMPLTENEYFIFRISEGQTTYSASMSSAVTGGIDGDVVNNVQAQPRTLVFDLIIKAGINVEEAKRYICQYIKPKQNGTLKLTQNDRITVLTGLVESIEMPRWENVVAMQVSLHCEQPYWEDIDYIVQTISEAIDKHYFSSDIYDMLYFPVSGIPLGEYDTIRTKRFVNDGDVSIGLEITINAIDTVTNPIIYNESGEYFGVGYGTDEKQLTLEAGDVVTITTHKGNKVVKLNGINIFDKIKPNSTWLQLMAGDNLFTINSDDESTANMYFNLTYKQRYI